MIALALALLAQAADPPPPVWQGVWQGTIGALPIRACLQRRTPDYAFGSYYYLSKLRSIRLDQQNGSTVWSEGEVSGRKPRWTFRNVGGALLTGAWSDGARTLPFRLTRLPGTDTDTGCGDARYNAPRLRPVTVRSAPARQDGIAYTKLSFDVGPGFDGVVIRTFALPGGDAATRRINARLRRGMTSDPRRGDWWECLAGSLDSHGSDGDYDDRIAPTLVTARWVAAREGSGTECGGAHPNFGETSLTFDRRTGAEVDLHDWLNAGAVERDASSEPAIVTIRPALRRAIIAHAGEMEPECRAAAQDEGFWDIGLARAGLRFTPFMPHVLTPCAEPVLVPWSALRPFLGPAGRAGLATLR